MRGGAGERRVQQWEGVGRKNGVKGNSRRKKAEIKNVSTIEESLSKPNLMNS